MNVAPSLIVEPQYNLKQIYFISTQMEIVVTELHKADRDGIPQSDKEGDHCDVQSVEEFGKFLMKRELEIYDVYKD